MRVSSQAIVFTRARVNLPWIYAMRLIIARMRTYVLSTQWAYYAINYTY